MASNKREQLISTAQGLFAREGYHATGIAELCTVNGLGKGAFYEGLGMTEDMRREF